MYIYVYIYIYTYTRVTGLPRPALPPTPWDPWNPRSRDPGTLESWIWSLDSQILDLQDPSSRFGGDPGDLGGLDSRIQDPGDLDPGNLGGLDFRIQVVKTGIPDSRAWNPTRWDLGPESQGPGPGFQV